MVSTRRNSSYENTSVFHALSIRCKYPTIETGRLIFPLNLAQSWTKRLTNYAQLCLRGGKKKNWITLKKKKKEKKIVQLVILGIVERWMMEARSRLDRGPTWGDHSQRKLLSSNVGERFAWIPVAIFFRAAIIRCQLHRQEAGAREATGGKREKLENGKRESERFEVRSRGKKTHLRAQYIKEIRVSDRITAGQRRPSSATLLHRHTSTPRKDNLMLAPINAKTTTFPALLPTSASRNSSKFELLAERKRKKKKRKEKKKRNGIWHVSPARKTLVKKRNAYLNSSRILPL